MGPGLSSVFQTCVVFKEVNVYFLWREGNVSDDATTNEAVFDAEEMWALFGVVDRYVVKFEVQELIHTDKGADDCNVVLKLDPNLTSNECFEE